MAKLLLFSYVSHSFLKGAHMLKSIFLLSTISFSIAFAQDHASIFEENVKRQVESQAAQISDWLLSTGDFSTSSQIYEMKTNSGSFEYKKFGSKKCGLQVTKKQGEILGESNQLLTQADENYVEVTLVKTDSYPNCEFDGHIYGIYRTPVQKISNYMYNTDPRMTGSTSQIVYTRTLRNEDGEIIQETIARPGSGLIGFYKWKLQSTGQIKQLSRVHFMSTFSIRKKSSLIPY
jgi:hypothetical protein